MYALYILIATYAFIILFRTYISVCVYDNNGSIIIQNEALASTTTILGTNSISEGWPTYKTTIPRAEEMAHPLKFRLTVKKTIIPDINVNFL